MFKYIFICFLMMFITGCEKKIQTFFPPEDLSNDIYVKINHYRVIHNLNIIYEDAFLDSIAEVYAQTMATNKFLNHENEDVRMQLAIEKLNITEYSEINASGILTGKDLISYWDTDDGEKMVITGDYLKIGIGVSNNDNISYVAVVFVK